MGDSSPQYSPCLGCRKRWPHEPEQEGIWCETCLARIPGMLRKAVEEYFSYEILTLNGWRIWFSQAHIEGDFVRLDNGADTPLDLLPPSGRRVRMFPRGVTIRFDQICWIVDAPDGS